MLNNLYSYFNVMWNLSKDLFPGWQICPVFFLRLTWYKARKTRKFLSCAVWKRCSSWQLGQPILTRINPGPNGTRDIIDADITPLENRQNKISSKVTKDHRQTSGLNLRFNLRWSAKIRIGKKYNRKTFWTSTLAGLDIAYDSGWSLCNVERLKGGLRKQFFSRQTKMKLRIIF